jgi:hypothetical protein
MILKSTKFGGNRTKDVEIGPDRRTNGQTDRHTDGQTDRFLYTSQTMFAGAIINIIQNIKAVAPKPCIYIRTDEHND